MKTLIDRTCSRYTEIKNKEFCFIVAAADTSKQAMERTLEGLRGFTSCLSGAEEKGIIYGTGAWKMGEIKGTPAMKKAYESGKAVS
jgi:hypothetical protein